MIDSIVTQWHKGRKDEGKDNSLKQCRGRQDRLMDRLMETFIEGEVTTSESMFRELGKLKPAQQRDVGTLVSKFTKSGSSNSSFSSFSSKTVPVESKSKATRRPSNPSPVKKSRTTGAVSSKAAAPAPASSDESVQSGSSHPFFGGAHVTSFVGKEQRVSSLYRKKENWPDFPELPDDLLFSTTFKTLLDILDILDRTVKEMLERTHQIRCPIRYIIILITYISIIINIPQATSFTIPSALPSVLPSVFNPNTHTYTHTHTTSFHKQLVYDTRTTRGGGGTKTTTRLHGIRGFRKWFSEQVR